jgi:hypothetical protein
MSRLFHRCCPLLASSIVVVLAATGCASDEAAARDGPSSPPAAQASRQGPSDAFDGAPARADKISVRPIAVRRVPGAEEGSFDDDATRVLADAVRRATGAVVVDEKSARDAFEKCEDLDNNCKSPLMNDFVNATWIVSARADALGAAHFAAGQVWEGSSVARRSNLQAQTRLHAIAMVGWDLGHFLRPKLELEAAAAAEAEADAAGAAPADG